MSAQQLLLPFRPVINLKGGLESGATMEIYESGGLTVFPIYADEELTDPLPNPLTANGFGVFPAVYYDNTQPIRVILKQANGTVIAQVDPYLGDNLPADTIAFQQTEAGAAARTVEQKLRDTVAPEDFGAVALEDGASPTASQSEAFRLALETGRTVACNDKTYVIGASVNPADNTVQGLVNGKFIRAAANQAAQDVMFDLRSQANVKVYNCDFDFGTTEDTGSTNDSSRSLLAVGSDNADPVTWVSGVEVINCRFTGDGNGTALFARGLAGAKIQCNEIYNRVVIAPSATNDVQNGIDVSHSRDVLVQGNTVQGLWFRVTGVLTRLYSRGILVTNSQNIRVTHNTVYDCDQCIDFSGAISVSTPNGNSGFVVALNLCHDFRTWGIKFANCARNGICIGNTIRNFGFGGIVGSGQSSAWPSGTAALATQHITIAYNYIYNPVDYFPRTDCIGIWFTYRTDYPGYPVGCRIVGNTIFDDTGGGRLKHGVALSDDNQVVVVGAPYNEVRDNIVRGQTAAPTLGCSPDGVCVLSANSSQSIANSTWVPVEWNVETIDSQGMHSQSTNLERILPNLAGWYEVDYTVVFAANATGIRKAQVMVTGRPAQGGQSFSQAVSGETIPLSGSCIVYLATGDHVRVDVWQSSGGVLNLNRVNSQFSARRIEQMGST